MHPIGFFVIIFKFLGVWILIGDEINDTANFLFDGKFPFYHNF